MKDHAILQELDTIGKNLQYSPEEAIQKIDSILNDERTLSREVHMKGLYYKGCAMMFDENLTGLTEIADKLRNVSEKLQNPENMMRSYNLLGIAQFNLSNYYQAITYFKKGYELARSLNDYRMIAVQSLNLSEVLFSIEKYCIAKEFIQVSIEHSTKIQYHRLTAKAYCRLGNILLTEKDVPGVILAIRDAKEYITSDFQAMDYFYYELLQADLSLYKGNRTQGKLHLERAEIHFNKKKTTRTEISLKIAYSDYARSRTRLSEAESLLLKALDLSKKIKIKRLEIDICSKLAGLYSAMNLPTSENTFLKQYYSLKTKVFHDFFDYDTMTNFLENDYKKDTCVSLQRENAKLKEERFRYEEIFDKEHKLNTAFDKIIRDPSLPRMIRKQKDTLRELFEIEDYSLYFFHPGINHWLDLRENPAIHALEEEQLNEVLTMTGEVKKEHRNTGFYHFLALDISHSVAIACINKEGAVLTVLLENARLRTLPKAVEGFIQRSMIYVFHLLEINHLKDSKLRCLDNIERLDLSTPEKELIKYVCRGLSNKKIAEELDVSIYTVRNQLSAIFHKLGITSRYQLFSRLFDFSKDSFS